MPRKPRNPYELNTLVDDYLEYYSLDILPRYFSRYLKEEYKPLVVKHKGWHYLLTENFWEYPPSLILKEPNTFFKPKIF